MSTNSRIGLDAPWIDYFMEIAQNVARRSTSGRRKIGAVLVHWESKRILGTGRNCVLPPGLRCDAGGCPRGAQSYDDRPAYANYSDCDANHAEVIAVEGNRQGYRPNDLVLFVTTTPCDDCWDFLDGKVSTVVHDD